MKSCIYRGTLVHRRHEAPGHRFRYPTFMLYVDLAELPELFDGRLLWSARRAALAWFRRADHVGDPARPLGDAIREIVAAATGKPPAGPVRLLTQLRYFGHNFNPASFYYCFDEDDRRLEAIVVEVHNTPWKERHCYVIPNEHLQPGPVRGTSEKAFHVSPFLPMDMTYLWTIGVPGEHLALRIRNMAAGKPVHDARIALSREPITSRSLALSLLRFPLHTLQIVWRIHWQAFKLWRKGCAVYTHPGNDTTVKEKYSA